MAPLSRELTTGLAVGLLLLLARDSHAVPAFARRYETSCLTCHAGAAPALNAYGRQVLENGLQLPEGAEEPAREAAEVRPGLFTERLAVLAQLPISARALGSASLSLGASKETQRGLGLRPVETLLLMTGGSVYPDVSFFATAEVAPTPQLHHASLGVHNLFGEGVLNVRVGQLLLFDFLRPEHRELTSVGNPAGVVRVGKNPTALDTTHLGLDAYGRLFTRKLLWHVAVVEGGREGLSDLDAYQDVFGEVQLSGQRASAGAFAYFGRTQLLDRSFGTAVRFTDPFRVVGGFGEATLGPATLYALVLNGHHGNPDGWGQPTAYWGVRAQLDVLLARPAMATVRYDHVTSADPLLSRELLTTMVSYLALTNLRISAEYVSVLNNLSESNVRLRLDLAI